MGKKESTRKTEQVNIRFTPEGRRYIERQAKAWGLTVSEYIRSFPDREQKLWESGKALEEKVRAADELIASLREGASLKDELVAKGEKLIALLEERLGEETQQKEKYQELARGAVETGKEAVARIKSLEERAAGWEKRAQGGTPTEEWDSTIAFRRAGLSDEEIAAAYSDGPAYIRMLEHLFEETVRPLLSAGRLPQKASRTLGADPATFWKFMAESATDEELGLLRDWFRRHISEQDEPEAPGSMTGGS